MNLSPEERKSCLALAREAIRVYVQTGKEIPFPEGAFFQQPGAAFVSLHKEGQLRGCIGMTEASNKLGETIIRCAISAAVQDPRFEPVREEELAAINLEISILSPLQLIKSVDEIEVGHHGLHITMGRYRGLLLPQVAIEHHWDRETFLRHTCLKAGLAPDAWKGQDVQIRIFSAVVFGEHETSTGA